MIITKVVVYANYITGGLVMPWEIYKIWAYKKNKKAIGINTYCLTLTFMVLFFKYFIEDRILIQFLSTEEPVFTINITIFHSVLGRSA